MILNHPNSYKRLQLFISTGILFGIWTNLFYQSKNIRSLENTVKYNSIK